MNSKNDNICVSIFSYQQSTILFHTEKTVPNHDAAVSFVFNFLLFSPDNRIQRIEKNIKLINEIEEKITKNTSTLTDNGILSIENQEKQELDALRNFLKQYFSHRQIFLLPFQDKVLERKFTWALLGTAYTRFPSEKKTINFNKDKIGYIKLTGNKSGLQILATSALMIEPGPPKSMLESFLSLSNFSKKHLDIDLHSMQLRTVTQMSRMYYTNNSPSFNSISFISPIKTLFQQLHSSKRGLA